MYTSAVALSLAIAACSGRPSALQPVTSPTGSPAAASDQRIPKETISDGGVESKVKQIICKQLEVSLEQLRPEASFINDLKADSLAICELVLAFEQEFKMTIPEEDAEQFKMVKDAINYIKSHVK